MFLGEKSTNFVAEQMYWYYGSPRQWAVIKGINGGLMTCLKVHLKMNGGIAAGGGYEENCIWSRFNSFMYETLDAGAKFEIN